MTILHSHPIWLPQTQSWMYTQVAELQRLKIDAHVACEKIENVDQFYVNIVHCFANEPKWRQAWDRSVRRLRLRRHRRRRGGAGGGGRARGGRARGGKV